MPTHAVPAEDKKGYEAPIGQALARVADGLDGMSSTLDRLENKLEGVLIPKSPVPETGPSDEEPPRSPLQRAINDQAAKIAILCGRLEYLIQRAEC